MTLATCGAATKLQQVCLSITDGKHGDCQADEGSGYFFLSAKDVRNGKLNYDDARQITEVDFLDTHRRTRLEPFDILISNSGTIGRMAVAKEHELTPKTTFQKSVALLKPDKSQVVPAWLYYCLQAASERLIAFAGGTAQKNLLLRDLRAFEIKVVPLATQRKIAGVLGAYDELIENNRRRIEILEEMARRLYREWFVQFRFPGHAHVPLTDSPLGKIPKGWEVKTLDDVCEFIVDSEHKTAPTQSEGFPMIRTPNIGKGYLLLDAARRVSAETYNAWTRRAVPKEGDLILAREAPVGNVGIVPKGERVCLGQRTVLLRANKSQIDPHLLLQILLGDYCQNSFSGASSGATVAHLNLLDIRRLPIPVPPKPFQSKFAPAFESIDQQIANLFQRNCVLQTTRDLLLPRLISGELDVSELPIEVEEAARDGE